MNFPITPERDPVAEIYTILSGLNAEDKFALATAMYAGALLERDEFSRHRLMGELPDALRQAMHRIKEIQLNGPVSLQ